MLQRGSDTFIKEHLADITLITHTSSLEGGRWPHVLGRYAINANRRVSVVVGVRTKVLAVSSFGDWHMTVLSSYFTTHSITTSNVPKLRISPLSLLTLFLQPLVGTFEDLIVRGVAFLGYSNRGCSRYAHWLADIFLD
jgi:hypothetical protein